MKFSVGEKVSLQVPLSYLKTADSISMLRPPDLVSLDEIGIIIGIRPNDLLEVKFRMGNFLIPSERLKILSKDS
ncbi:NAD(P)H dehydrogenase assembly family protein [Prochlorococcus sp. MIT 0916]|uniref:NAD(P)H dehydrogenase assembly family protein n=1 Tax=Prochlorococcus sp. MIT 0916 TaxID=3082521 RepID=UPI0039B36E92